jgi:hypothetical protein
VPKATSARPTTASNPAMAQREPRIHRPAGLPAKAGAGGGRLPGQGWAAMGRVFLAQWQEHQKGSLEHPRCCTLGVRLPVLTDCTSCVRPLFLDFQENIQQHRPLHPPRCLRPVPPAPHPHPSHPSTLYKPCLSTGVQRSMGPWALAARPPTATQHQGLYGRLTLRAAAGAPLPPPRSPRWRAVASDPASPAPRRRVRVVLVAPARERVPGGPRAPLGPWRQPPSQAPRRPPTLAAPRPPPRQPPPPPPPLPRQPLAPPRGPWGKKGPRRGLRAAAPRPPRGAPPAAPAPWLHPQLLS